LAELADFVAGGDIELPASVIPRAWRPTIKV
jgi:hypothetical protein